ncbi:MAG: hypothetical protein AB7E42_08085, partial [Anaerotignaceae bacterium]
MRKRLLSILLTICMVFSLMPQMAMAEDYTYAGDVTETGLDLTTAPDYNARYDAGEYGTIFWQPGTNTLTLSDANINVTSGSAYAITLKNNAEVTIVVEGNDNVLKSSTCGIGQESWDPGPNNDNPWPYPNTTITGSGTLEVTTTSTDINQGAIDLGYGNLTISDSVTVNPISGVGSMSICLENNGNLSILDNASVTVPSKMEIYVATGEITIDTHGTITECDMYPKDFNYSKGNLNAWVNRVNSSGS